MKRPRGRPPSSLEVYAAAKVNIGLRVGARRPDGYHDVCGCLQTISVLDRLVVRAHASPDEASGELVSDVRGCPVALTVDGPEATDDLLGGDNLVLRAARRLAADVRPRPTSIALTKGIPVAAGLGGGSADAAAALTGLAVAWAADLKVADLMARAAELGSDVPAILVGGLVHVSGGGERARGIGCVTGTRFVLGVAAERLRTPDVYAKLDELRDAGYERVSASLAANDLQPAAALLAPRTGAGVEAMGLAGAPVVFVAGSGPTVVGLVPDPAAADDVAARLPGQFHRVLVADPLPWGVRLALPGARSRSTARPDA